MPYIIKFPKGEHRKTTSRHQLNHVDVYLVKDGELKTMVAKGREMYVSGAKTTAKLAEASRFETISEASRYHGLIGVRGKRGQITKVEE